MELRDDHSICRSRLRDIAEDIASLRADNSRLRSANAKLLNLLAICPRGIEGNTSGALPSNYSPPSTIGYNRRHCEGERGLSPNSVPVRSRMANGRSVGEHSRIVGHKGMSQVQEQPGELELRDQTCGKQRVPAPTAAAVDSCMGSASYVQYPRTISTRRMYAGWSETARRALTATGSTSDIHSPARR